MHILRKLVRLVLFLLVGLAAIGGILYAVGLRVVFDGGGGTHFAFTKSADERAAEIEKHREAQRAQAAAAPPAPAHAQPDPAAAAPVASPTAEKPAPARCHDLDALDELSWTRS